MTDKQPAAPEERLESSIFFIRGQKVMLSLHLAEIYGIEPRVMEQAIERNIGRFPEDALFQLSPEEFAALGARLAASARTAPYAFTRQGVAILSSALFDERALHESQESCAPTCSCRK
ncbi:MAG: hypothetical protein A2Z94_01325 [Gallionellales bacterium GWA2_55_18]|nr:MAG: hypothetical protein A2Z94_01325 [Gallionellales bacterium GWA2_55_18]